MDDYEHGLSYVFPKSARDCGDDNVWSVLDKARAQAIQDATTYLFKSIAENVNKFVDGFQGSFGEVNTRVSNTADKSCRKDIVGFTIVPEVYNGAELLLKKIWLAIDKAGTYDVHVYDLGNPNTPVFTTQIIHPGGQKLVGANVIFGELPLSEAGKPIIYAVAYNRAGGFPLNYAYHCGCGPGTKPAWMRNKYMDSRGFCVNNINEVVHKSSSCNRDYTGGLIVEFELVCDPAGWICSQSDTFWRKSSWGRIFAKAVQIIATRKVISAILDTGRINFYTLVSAEALIAKSEAFAKLTDELMVYLSTNMPDNASHCWHCKSGDGFKKRGILI